MRRRLESFLFDRMDAPLLDGTGLRPDPELAAHGVAVVGRATGLVERFYAISLEKKLKHPAVVAISDGARRDLFAS